MSTVITPAGTVAAFATDRGVDAELALIAPSRRLAWTTSVRDAYPQHDEVGLPVLASTQTSTLMVMPVWPVDKPSELAWAELSSEGRVRPIGQTEGEELSPSDAPVAVPTSTGDFAIVWGHGRGASVDLVFAVLGHNGMRRRRTLLPDANPDGMVLLAVPGGLALIFTPFGLEAPERRGVRVLYLSEQGDILRDSTVWRGGALLPAAVWDGETIAIAFQWDEHRVGFLRIDGAGRIVTGPTEILAAADPAINYRPTSIQFDKGGYWVTSHSKLIRGNVVIGPAEGQWVAVSKEGQASRPVTISSFPAQILGPTLFTTNGTISSLYIENSSRSCKVRTLELTCNRPASE